VTATQHAADALRVWNLFQQTYLLSFRHLEQITNREGLSYSQAAALGVLSSAGRSLPLSHLARALTQEAQSTTELADRLERRGLVRRIRDPRDRRLELTPDGQKLNERLQPALAEGSEQLFRDLGERDRETLTRILGPTRDRAGLLLGLDEKRMQQMAQSIDCEPKQNGASRKSRRASGAA
jgi:DNA-binding MarR family transcriptional regulator